MSSSDKRNKIPDAPVPASSSGNLLSSVAPPSELPNFVTAVTAALPSEKVVPQVTSHPLPQASHFPLQVTSSVQAVPVQTSQPQTPEKFSPAIPLSKGQPLLSIRTPEDSQTTQSPESLPASSPEVDKVGDIMPGSGLLTWVKGAVSSGGLLQRVAEKAKSSVDSMITTLDPQMKEYLNSGGDIFIVVASDKDVKISPIREAFQAVFGKATVVGYPAQSDVTAVQPVGCGAAYAAAKQRIAHIRSTRADLTNNVPVVAVEGYLHEVICDRWFESSVLVLTQPSLSIELLLQSQGTPVPAAAVAAARAATAADYEHAQTGFSLTIGSIMAASLQTSPSDWQEASTGVSRREILTLAARALAGAYRQLLAISAAQPQ